MQTTAAAGVQTQVHDACLVCTCRPAAAHPGPALGMYGGADAAACALASRFPLQQLGAPAPPCSGLPASLFAPTQQNLHL